MSNPKLSEPMPIDSTQLFKAATNPLPGHGPTRSTKETLTDLATQLTGDESPDTYGTGEYLQAFEQKLATLFGKESAVFMPSGTMAQQIALRVWCDENKNPTVAMHPSSHLEFAEHLGYQYLHNLRRIQFGSPEFVADRILEPKDFHDLQQVPGAALIELPYRPLGGILPGWENLTETRAWADGHKVPMHLDGARIWQCRPFYEKSFEEIGALFDSIYVSFYKDLGALPGCLLMGPESFIKTCRMWQRRYGGTLYTLAPNVASAQIQMERVLPVIDDWVAKAKDIAAAFAACDGVRVNPDPPHTNMFQLFIEGNAEALTEKHHELAEETGTFLFHSLRPAAVPGFAWTEVHVFENGARFDASTIAPFMDQLMG
ncbi:MAG: beta-eliminating lyase-related protein [Pseudomonadales bacterium]